MMGKPVNGGCPEKILNVESGSGLVTSQEINLWIVKFCSVSLFHTTLTMSTFEKVYNTQVYMDSCNQTNIKSHQPI